MKILDQTAVELEQSEFQIDALGKYDRARQQFIAIDHLPLHITASGNGMTTYSATTNVGKDNDADDKST